MADDPSQNWFYSRDGQQHGPVTEAELREMAGRGEILPSDLVWRPGLPQWAPAGTMGLGISGAPAAPPPAPPPMPPPLRVPPQLSSPPPTPPPGPGGPMPAPPLAYASYHPTPGQPPDIGNDPGMRWLLPVGRSGWAIAAGYLGLLSFVVLPAPFALIISIIAIRDIRRHPTRHGMGRAIFGLVMGVLGTAALCMMIAAGAFG